MNKYHEFEVFDLPRGVEIQQQDLTSQPPTKRMTLEQTLPNVSEEEITRRLGLAHTNC